MRGWVVLGALLAAGCAVKHGGPGRVFMVLATWPDSAPKGVPTDVDAIIGSIRTVEAV